MTRARVYFTADDFGLSPEVNEAVEIAHRQGVLTHASLMVAGSAAADAVRRARAMPNLKVGLHLVAVEGPATDASILTDAEARFGSGQVGLAFRYGFSPRARRTLTREVAAQFAAYARTGLALRHADAHKHMHLHPVVGRLLIGIGRMHGLPHMRVPAEPPAVLRACGETVGIGDHALFRWCGWLRAAARRAGLTTSDACFGLRWTGHMTADRLLRLGRHLPPGESEIYAHPATGQNAMMRELMPGYDQRGELAALLDPAVRKAFGLTAPACGT